MPQWGIASQAIEVSCNQYSADWSTSKRGYDCFVAAISAIAPNLGCRQTGARAGTPAIIKIGGVRHIVKIKGPCFQIRLPNPEDDSYL